MKILTVIGARPQFIKAALLSKAFSKERHISEILVHTGQHYDYNMSGAFFEDLKIRRPDHNLNVGSLPGFQQIMQMTRKLTPLYRKERPDVTLVYGDTNSTLAASLAAARSGIPIAHVEAGLRSFDLAMPEEVNRVLTDHLSSVLFCPTVTAVKNLKNENICEGLYLVGDIMYELALKSAKASDKVSKAVQALGLRIGRYLLVTIHRQSNTDDKHNLSSIVSGLVMIDKDIVFPLHPRTRKMLAKFKLLEKLEGRKNIRLIGPQGYLDMISLEKSAEKILTDSGGVQKEAYFFKIPCVTLRDRTEWVETKDNGWNKLVGADTGRIIKEACNRQRPGEYKNHYGSADASRKIISILKKRFAK